MHGRRRCGSRARICRAAHTFYERLNRPLDDAGFDAFVEGQCAPFYADGVGRPSLAAGRYFRLLLLGYFEGLDSERAIAWRAADSLSIRQFLGLELHEAPPADCLVVLEAWTRWCYAGGGTSSRAIKEQGFSEKRHPVARPRDLQWADTSERLKGRCSISDDRNPRHG